MILNERNVSTHRREPLNRQTPFVAYYNPHGSTGCRCAALTHFRSFGPDNIEVACKVSLLPNGDGGFKLAVSVEVGIAGVAQAKAEEIVKAAHAVCPYSNAIRGNVDVDLKFFAQ